MHYDNGPTGPLTYAIIRRIMTAARTAGAFNFANVRYLTSEIRYYPEFLYSAGLSRSLLPTNGRSRKIRLRGSITKPIRGSFAHVTYLSNLRAMKLSSKLESTIINRIINHIVA